MKVGFSRVGDVWTEGRDGWMDASTAQELFEWPRWIGIGGGGALGGWSVREAKGGKMER